MTTENENDARAGPPEEGRPARGRKRQGSRHNDRRRKEAEQKPEKPAAASEYVQDKRGSPPGKSHASERASGREYRSIEYISPDCPPEVAAMFLSADWCPYCSGRPPKKLKDHFSPPLEPFDPDAVPPEKVAETLEAWRTRLLEKNFVVEGCEHCTPRDLLRRIAEALDEEFVEIEKGTWHLTAGDECEECFIKREHERATFDWKQRVLDEVHTVRATLRELEDFLEEADREIAADEADPRRALGRLAGLDRLMPLVPCVLTRLEEDIEAGLFSLPVGGEGGDANSILDALEALARALRAALVWYERDDVDWALRLAHAALEGIQKLSGADGAGTVHKGRLFRDLARISDDVRLLCGQLEDFQENRQRRPIWVEDADANSKERWAEYYREQAMREEPIISVVEMEGLSKESLEKGLKLQEAQSNLLNSRIEDTKKRDRMEKQRRAAFDPEMPALFLDLPEIPEVKKDEDAPTHPRYDNESGLTDAWFKSLPELAEWEKEEMYRDADTNDIGDGKMYNHRDDPVFKMLDPFVHDLMRAMGELPERPSRDKWESAAPRNVVQEGPGGPTSRKGTRENGAKKKSTGEEQKVRHRDPVEDYVLLLAMKSAARMSSCGVNAEMVRSDAPIKGCHIFVRESLEKIAKAIDFCGPAYLRKFGVWARRISERIRP